MVADELAAENADCLVDGCCVMLADGYSAKLHPILAAVKRVPPAGWTTVDVSKLDNQTAR